MKSNIKKLESSEKKYFDSFSRSYDKNYGYNSVFTKYKILKKANHCIKNLKINEKLKPRILEIGCGTGEYTRHIAKKNNFKITATDISAGMIKVAKEKCKKYKNVNFCVESAYEMKSIRTNSIDAVIGFYILHHLDIKTVYKEINRVLKQKGKVYFYEPNILNPVVFLIKSIPFLKKKAGDSKDEWAINPMLIKKYFPGFKIKLLQTTEFIPASLFKNSTLMKRLDKVSFFLGGLPVIKYFGGSVVFLLEKK